MTKTTATRLDPERAWQETLTAVDKITDGLGKGVDKGIRETVAILQLHGFNTTGSCEGHTDWGLPYPWIEITATEPTQPDWRKNENLRDQWKLQNRRVQHKILPLLQEFYQKHSTAYENQLFINSLVVSGEFRIQSVGGPATEVHRLRAKKDKLRQYQHEMADFTKFLKNKWLAG
jgi:hypothetical protein